LIEPMPACLGYGPGLGQLRADGTVLIVGEGFVNNADPDMGIGIVVLTYLP